MLKLDGDVYEYAGHILWWEWNKAMGAFESRDGLILNSDSFVSNETKFVAIKQVCNVVASKETEE